MVPLTGGGHRWISEGLDRSFAPTAGTRPPVWLDDDTLLATAEDRGETHLYRLAVDGSAEPEPLTQRADHRARRSTPPADASPWPSPTVEHPAEIVTLDGPVTARHPQLPRVGDASPCRPPTAPTRSTPGSCGPRDFEPRRKYPVLLNVHGGPFTQYGETFFDEAQMQAAAGFVVLMSQPARRQRPGHGVGPGDHRPQAPR